MRVLSLFILSLLVFSSCQDNSSGTNVPETEIPETVSVNGTVFDVFDGGTLPAPEVTLQINGETYQSNESGEFSLTEMPLGEHEATFTSDYHHTLDTVLTFEYNEDSSNNFNIELTPIKLDLLPFEPGNKWVYKIETEEHRHQQACMENCTGSSFEYSTETVEVIGVTEDDSSYIYEIQERIEGIYINEDEDTTFFDKQAFYNIIEDKQTSTITPEFVQPASNNMRNYVSYFPRGPLFEGKIWARVSRDNENTYSMRRYIPYSRVNENAGVWRSIELDKGMFSIPLDGYFYTASVDTGTVLYKYPVMGGHNSSQGATKELISFEEN